VSRAVPAAGAPTLSDRIFKVEQRFVALALAIMGVVVFLDVVHRVASREFTPVATAISFLTGVVLVVGGLRLRGQQGAKTWGIAIAIVLACWGALKAFLFLIPNGLVWSQTLGLVLMLWVGVIGASMATREHRHLALDLGSKLWPKSMLPKVQGLGNLVTALFCLALALLACVSLRDHFRDWSDTDGAGGAFPALAIPKWIAFAGVPIGFFLMTARFFAQALESFRGKVEEDDAMHMLGLGTDSPLPPGEGRGEGAPPS
jgi:TRAP-type C4-dicarboxylate transport system permease small subunit